MAIDPATGIAIAQATVGTIGSLFSKSQDQINREYYAKLKRQALNSARAIRNDEMRSLAIRARQNNAGIIQANERIARQTGIYGTSAHIGAVNRGLNEGAKNTNNVREDIRSEYTRNKASANQITAPPEKSNEDLYASMLSSGTSTLIGSIGSPTTKGVDTSPAMVDIKRVKARSARMGSLGLNPNKSRVYDTISPYNTRGVA